MNTNIKLIRTCLDVTSDIIAVVVLVFDLDAGWVPMIPKVIGKLSEIFFKKKE